jgi:hypothetical protein
MATDFKYASQSDLETYYPNFTHNDSKRQILGWTTETISGDTYYVCNDAGFVSQLFIDGKMQDKQTIATTKIDDAQEAIDASETDIDITLHSDWTADTFIKIDDEIMYVESATNDTQDRITVVRGVLGTTATTHDLGADIYLHFQPSANGQFLYDENNDFVILKYGSNPDDLLVESGVDNKTYYDQMLVNASMELNNILDARFATPLPKVTQIDENTAFGAKEYDAIIIKMTCYLCVSNILRSEGNVDEADYYYNLVTNAERAGMADRLNAGEFKLSYEVDAKDSQGRVMQKSVAGSMDLVETAGEYFGEKYDVLKIICTVGGAYGVAKVKVQYFGDNKLLGSETGDEFVSGGLQLLISGLYVRFEGSSMTVDDYWKIEVNSKYRKISNASSGSIDLTRKGYIA